jgi:hypothetical protein
MCSEEQNFRDILGICSCLADAMLMHAYFFYISGIEKYGDL